MVPDYHIHTFLCKHADGDPSDYIRSAEAEGISEICFTDHAPSHGGYDPAHRMSIDQFSDYREMVKAQKTDSVEVLFGIEADYYEGCEEFLTPWLKEQNFDLVIGSVHYIRDWGFDNPETIRVWDSVDVTKSWNEYLELLSRLARTGLYDVIGHLDLTKKFGYIPEPEKLKEIMEPVLDSISESEMVIELNTSGLRKPIKEIYPSLAILQMAKNKNIPICFGSDAHTAADVGSAFDQAIELARSAGYTTSTRFRKREKEQIPLPEVS